MKYTSLTLIIYITMSYPCMGIADIGIADIDITTYPDISGARNVGMGYASKGLADDSTSMIINPGGIIDCETNEFSAVYNFKFVSQNISYKVYPESDSKNNCFDSNLKQLSLVFPIKWNQTNMSLGFSYLHVFDFLNEWKFPLLDSNNILSTQEKWVYRQSGQITTISITLGIEVLEYLSMGVTCNFWQNSIMKNTWEQKYQMKGNGTFKIDNSNMTYRLDKIMKYNFKGFNANFGLLYKLNYQFSLGMVLKTPFTADISYQYQRQDWFDSEKYKPSLKMRNDKLRMPLSYGIGFLYRYSDNFFITGDFYQVLWNDFIYKENNVKEISPINKLPVSESNIGRTNHVRLGCEYLLYNELQNEKGYSIPARFGIFYDPAPDENHPDDRYGFSIGVGFTKLNKYSIDCAYQFTYANNISESKDKVFGFSEDLNEHQLFLSIIYYFDLFKKQ